MDQLNREDRPNYLLPDNSGRPMLWSSKAEQPTEQMLDKLQREHLMYWGTVQVIEMYQGRDPSKKLNY